VADAFGDTDTADLAAAARCVTDAARIGFRTKPTLSALAQLEQTTSRPPIGLVFGSGFEDRPKLITVLSRRYRLLGNDAATVARAKDPAAITTLLDSLDIPHPETTLAPPAQKDDWLSKRIGGSGGTHIVPADGAEQTTRRYYQRRLDGTPYSVLALTGAEGARVIAMSRQWSAGCGPRPYRYGGAVGPVSLAPAIETAMRTATERLCAALGLVGLVSFDFILAGETPYLLEINPRPSATLDIFDDAAGALFKAHIAACSDGRLMPLPSPDEHRAAAILYADRGPLRVGNLAWPPWTADRPAPGSRIPRYRPIATVFAHGPTPEATLDSCRQRLDELGEMLYGQARNMERNDNAEVQRPGPERLSARRQAR
jgi:predicted ATP-grasp superfamily ATP-dependent carboligase